MTEKTILSRKELYKKVWTTPMIHLAKEFGISDRGLAKICQRYDIPRPRLGYWAKLEHGKKVSKVPSPKILSRTINGLRTSTEKSTTSSTMKTLAKEEQ